MLNDICKAFRERVRMIPGIESAPDSPPGQMANETMLIIYAQPTSTFPGAHGGPPGKVVIDMTADIVIEWHLKISPDQVSVFIEQGTPLHDQAIGAIWAEFMLNQFGGFVTGLTSVDTNTFGAMGWGDDFTYGFRLSAAVTYSGLVTDGRQR